MNFKEVYEVTVPLKKRKEEKYNTWVAWVVRPLSVLVTLPFIKTKIKPTTITAGSIVCAIIGFFILVIAKTSYMKILGWLGFFAWSVLDGVDGNLARYKNECSSLGDLWDTMGGYAAMILIYFASGILAFSDENLLHVSWIPSYMYIIFGGVTAIFSIFPRLILHKKKSSAVNSKATGEYTDTANFGIIKRMVGNITSPSGIMQVFVLVSIVFHLFNIFIVIYMIINLLIMVITLRNLLSE